MATDMTAKFLQWALEHGKEYKSLADFEMRLLQFTKLELEIQEFNAKGSTSTVGHNKFSDWTEEEWANFLSYRPRESNAILDMFSS